MLACHDPAPLAQPGVVERSHADVDPLPDSEVSTTVHIEDSHIVRAHVNELPVDAERTVLNMTTTIGNEVVHCARTVGDDPDDANCRGVLQGKALIGGTVYVATGGTPVAKGTIVHHRREHEKD